MRSNGARRILIVEDGVDDRLVYRFMFQRQTARDMRVMMATTGADAAAALRTGGFDCMVLDHQLPDMDGFELLDQVKGPDGSLPCPVVMVTGNQSPHIAPEAARRHVHAVLRKDEIDEPGLLNAVDAAIAGQPSTAIAIPDKVSPIAVPTEYRVSASASPRVASISDAKHAVAAAFGVSPENVEVTIRV